MKRTVQTISVTVVFLFLASTFGWLSVHVSAGDKDFGFFNEPIRFMYSFLDQFETSVKEVQEISPTYLKTPENHNSFNKLSQDLNVLISYSASDYKRHVVIKNLRNDSIQKTWKIKQVFNKHDRVLHPMNFPNGDLVYFAYMRAGLKRIDAEGNELWSQDSIVPHHSMNLDNDGNLWLCTGNPPSWSTSGKFNINGRTVYFMDDFITKVDPENGKILYHKSIAEILKENGLNNYLIHSQSGQDPLHLNDIQPALKTTSFYEEGDLFISLKQISLIFLFRPATGKIIKSIKGPFSAQHDVDFYNDSILTWFNNNSYTLWTNDSKPTPENPEQIKEYANLWSNIVRYNLATDELSFIGDSLFREKLIFTATEGLHEFINDSTYLVEQQNEGYIWVIQNDEVLYKNVFHSTQEGYHHLPNWYRIIK